MNLSIAMQLINFAYQLFFWLKTFSFYYIVFLYKMFIHSGKDAAYL